MRYSLVVPHYDDAERLERLLCSVPTQRNDLEVMVIDDWSPDQTALRALKLRWPKVVWLQTPENAGAGAARNVGLEAAQGRWLVFADSDDEFLPDAFDVFDRSLRDEDQLVYFLAEAVQEKDGSPSERSGGMNQLVIDYAASPNDETLRQLRLLHVNPVAKIYSNAFIRGKGLRFDPIRRSNDVAFNVLAAAQARQLRAEPTAVYRVYRRAGSLTADVSAKAFMERFMADRSVAKRLADLGVRKARSATGQMVLSLKYGPSVALRVWLLSIFSSMYIEWGRIFDLKRWQNFFKNQQRARRERSK